MTEAIIHSDSTPVEMASLYEGTSVQVQPAPFAKRALAFAIDLGIISAASYLLFLVGIFALAGTAGLGLAFRKVLKHNPQVIAGFSITFFILTLLGVLLVLLFFDAYFVWFESRRGSTPGKGFLGLKVVSLRGSRLTTGQCVMRELFRHIDCLLVFPGLISVSLSKRRQRLGDLMASTIVVYSARSANQQRYLYVGQEDYQWLNEKMPAAAVPIEDCEKFLAFAYPEYVLRSRASSPEALAAWETLARGYLPDAKEGEVDQRSLLRYFAEVCFQTKNAKGSKK